MALEFLKRYLFALLRMPWLFSAGVFNRNHRLLISEICRHFGYFKKIQGIPGAAVKTILPDFGETTILAPIGTYGSANHFDLMVINELVRRNQPRTLFEIGTFDGRTTLNLAHFSPADARVFTLDLPASGLSSTKLPMYSSETMYVEKSESGITFRNAPEAKKITQLFGDSAAFDFSPYRQKMDFIFIDGAHTYEYVKSDTERALDMLSPAGGIILWHDYLCIEGLTHALNDLYRQKPEFRTMRFLEGTSLVYWKR